jgi:hypothetical protein
MKEITPQPGRALEPAQAPHPLGERAAREPSPKRSVLQREQRRANREPRPGRYGSQIALEPLDGGRGGRARQRAALRQQRVSEGEQRPALGRT